MTFDGHIYHVKPIFHRAVFRLHKGHVGFGLGFTLVVLGLSLVCVRVIYYISTYILSGKPNTDLILFYLFLFTSYMNDIFL